MINLFWGTEIMSNGRRLKKKAVTALAAICAAAAAGAGLTVFLLQNRKTAEIPTATATPAPEISTAGLFFTGDTVLHEGVWLEANDWGKSSSFDFMPIIGEIGSYAAQYDLAYYNQESILGGTELGLSAYPQFNGPQEFGRDMISCGFNLVSVANNHTLDKGEEGIAASEAFWDAQPGVVHAGASLSRQESETIEVHEINGISYAFLSWTYGCNSLQTPEGKEWLVNIYGDGEVYPDRREEMLEQIRNADQMADVVIMAVHWGTEYTTEITEDQRSLAESMAEAGADIIIGNHPHSIQPVEWLNDGKTICFYAMGNLVSEQDGIPQNIGLAGALTIQKTVTADKTEISIRDVKADLLYSYHNEKYRDLHVYPFSSLTDDLLSDHASLYQQYMNDIVMRYQPDIETGGIFG